MQAKLYELKIADGYMDVTHGITHPITELYLYSHDVGGRPLDVGINVYQDELHVVEFASDTGRYNGANLLRELPWDEDIEKLAVQVQAFVGVRSKTREQLGLVIEK